MKMTIKYSINFFSEWHTGSGLTSGSDLSSLVIKDKDDLPYIPGRTLKGLLREAAEELNEFGKCTPEFIEKVFGLPPKDANVKSQDPEENERSKMGSCFFSNAVISNEIAEVVAKQKLSKFFYRSVASTAIDESGIAKQKSLRAIETTIPCELYAEIMDFPEKYVKEIEFCFKWIKRLGQNRHRGLGRCQFELLNLNLTQK